MSVCIYPLVIYRHDIIYKLCMSTVWLSDFLYCESFQGTYLWITQGNLWGLDEL